MVFSPLISGTTPHHDKYSSRQGRTPQRVIPHHFAGTSDGPLTNPNVQASANYIIYADGRILGQVPEEFRAWTSGDFNADANSITYEVQDSTFQVNGNDDDPLSWQISAKALDAVIRLTADIAKRYKWGAVSAGNVRGHREFVSTSCPGGYFWRQFPSVRTAAHKLLTGGGSTAPVAPPVAGKSIYQLAQEVIAGVHGSGDARRKSLGANYDKVQNEVNRLLGVSTPKAPLPAVKTISQLADETINGVHGNGEERQRRLGSNYNAVQNEINRRLGASKPAASSGPSISQLADAVLRGEYGDGADRQRRLGSKYNAVQAEVNRRFA